MLTSHQPLFLRVTTSDALFVEKTAASLSRVPDDEKKWPQHIFSELMREMPFLSNYDVDIVLDRTEPEAGAAFGYAQVRNKTLSRPQDNVSSPGNIIRIPIIVHERRLQKFYIFECGKQTYPLTEDRVQQALLNPSVFDTDATRVPTSGSLIDQVYPPYQQRQGFGRVSEPSAAGLSKLSSAPAKTIDDILADLDQREKLASMTETEKTALIFGAKHPSNAHLGSAAMSQKDREHAVVTYGRQKAEEDPTSRWKAILTGAAVGGVPSMVGGAIAGAQHHGLAGAVTGGLGAGAVGAGMGGLTGAVMQHGDEREIKTWRATKGNPAKEKGLAVDRIRQAVESNAEAEREHRRAVERALLLAAVRPSTEIHHHYGSSSAGPKNAPDSSPPKVEKYKCAYCGVGSTSNTGNCSSCGASMSHGSKMAHLKAAGVGADAAEALADFVVRRTPSALRGAAAGAVAGSGAPSDKRVKSALRGALTGGLVAGAWGGGKGVSYLAGGMMGAGHAGYAADHHHGSKMAGLKLATLGLSPDGYRRSLLRATEHLPPAARHAVMDFEGNLTGRLAHSAENRVYHLGRRVEDAHQALQYENQLLNAGMHPQSEETSRLVERARQARQRHVAENSHESRTHVSIAEADLNLSRWQDRNAHSRATAEKAHAHRDVYDRHLKAQDAAAGARAARDNVRVGTGTAAAGAGLGLYGLHKARGD